MLTLNSVLINAYAMPNLDRNIGTCPADLSLGMKLPMALVAGVSTTSWLLALTLGSSVVLKTATADVFFLLIPACYGIGMIASLCAVAFFHRSAKATMGGNAGAK